MSEGSSRLALARGIAFLVAGACFVALVFGRLHLQKGRSEQAVADTEVAICEAIVDGSGQGQADGFVAAGRDALRLAPSDPYALFLFQLSRALIGAHQTSPLPEDELPALELLLAGDVDQAREAVTALRVNGSMLEGRHDLWSQLLGSVEVLIATECQ